MSATRRNQRHSSTRGIGRLGAMCVFILTALACGAASAQARGYMLYNQHCVECHTAQVHWRDGRLATDWKSLNAQVRRWQLVAHLNWSEEDIQNVTRYLNTRYYDFWPPTEITTVPVTVPANQRRSAVVAR